MFSRSVTALCLALALLGLAAANGGARSGKAGEWPQWRGPDRTGISQEKGLLKEWPAEGPSLVWKATGLGEGYTAPSIARGRIYGMGYQDEDEVVWARDVKNGEELWAIKITEANRLVGYPYGPRSTPTVDGKVLYALGVSGDLVCLSVGDGKIRWRKNLVEDFGGRIPNWGYTESVLIDGNQLICTPGGRTAGMVALNKKTGETIWQSRIPGVNVSEYSSAIIATVGGTRQYLQFTRAGIVGVDAKSGNFLWNHNPWSQFPRSGIKIATVLFKDDHVFGGVGYNTGGGLAKISKTADGFTAEEVYFTRQMQNHHGGMIILGDYLYGFNRSSLTCLNFLTGEVQWEDRSVGKGSLIYADGHLYVRSERGTIGLVEVNPKEYMEKARFEQPDRSGKRAWSHPVVAGGRLYLRDQDVLLSYAIK